MSKTIAAPVTVSENEDESHAEYLLRLAAAYIRAYAPDKSVIHDDYGFRRDEMEAVTGVELAESIDNEVNELETERTKPDTTIRIRGKLIQAGGDSQHPTLTLTTTREELKKQRMIPLYQECEVCHTPI